MQKHFIFKRKTEYGLCDQVPCIRTVTGFMCKYKTIGPIFWIFRR